MKPVSLKEQFERYRQKGLKLEEVGNVEVFSYPGSDILHSLNKCGCDPAQRMYNVPNNLRKEVPFEEFLDSPVGVCALSLLVRGMKLETWVRKSEYIYQASLILDDSHPDPVSALLLFKAEAETLKQNAAFNEWASSVEESLHGVFEKLISSEQINTYHRNLLKSVLKMPDALGREEFKELQESFKTWQELAVDQLMSKTGWVVADIFSLSATRKLSNEKKEAKKFFQSAHSINGSVHLFPLALMPWVENEYRIRQKMVFEEKPKRELLEIFTHLYLHNYPTLEAAYQAAEAL